MFWIKQIVVCPYFNMYLIQFHPFTAQLFIYLYRFSIKTRGTFVKKYLKKNQITENSLKKCITFEL